MGISPSGPVSLDPVAAGSTPLCTSPVLHSQRVDPLPGLWSPATMSVSTLLPRGLVTPAPTVHPASVS